MDHTSKGLAFEPRRCDVDLDGDCDFDDLLLVVGCFGQTPEACGVPRADVIGDGLVNILDISAVGSDPFFAF